MVKQQPRFTKGKPSIALRMWPHHGIIQVGITARIMVTSTERLIASLSLYLITHELKAHVALDLPWEFPP